MVFVVWFSIPLCPAPSIGGADGLKRADCLSAEGLPQAGLSEASFRALRPLQSVDGASIVLPGKASGETRRAAIFRL
jgi:hypothetical protein